MWDVAGRGKERVVDQPSLMNSIAKIALPTKKEHVDNLKPTGMIALPGSGYTFGEGGIPRQELFGTAALSLETRAPSDDFTHGACAGYVFSTPNMLAFAIRAQQEYGALVLQVDGSGKSQKNGRTVRGTFATRPLHYAWLRRPWSLCTVIDVAPRIPKIRRKSQRASA